MYCMGLKFLANGILLHPKNADGGNYADLSPNPSPQERGVCREARERVWGESPSPVERDLGRGLTTCDL